MELENKTVVITGASEGIGKHIALACAEKGAQLALIARNEKNLIAVQKEAEKKGALSVFTYPCDIQIATDLEQTIAHIKKDFKSIHVLINNAGIWQKLMQVDVMKPGTVDSVIQTNLTALIHCTRLILPELKKQREAALINVVSKSGVVAQENQSVYTASKYGVRGFTEVLKADLKGSSVRVSGVYQSGTNTHMFQKAGEDFSTEDFTEPQDLADVIVFMLSQPAKIWLHDVRVQY